MEQKFQCFSTLDVYGEVSPCVGPTLTLCIANPSYSETPIAPHHLFRSIHFGESHIESHQTIISEHLAAYSTAMYVTSTKIFAMHVSCRYSCRPHIHLILR